MWFLEGGRREGKRRKKKSLEGEVTGGDMRTFVKKAPQAPKEGMSLEDICKNKKEWSWGGSSHLVYRWSYRWSIRMPSSLCSISPNQITLLFLPLWSVPMYSFHSASNFLYYHCHLLHLLLHFQTQWHFFKMHHWPYTSSANSSKLLPLAIMFVQIMHFKYVFW